MRNLTPKRLTTAAIATSAVLLGATALTAPGFAQSDGAPESQAASHEKGFGLRGHHSRTINLAELEARTEQRFVSLDENGDGLISAEEFEQADPADFKAHMGRHKQKPHGKRNAKKQRSRQGDSELRKQLEDRAFAELDADGNGQISESEFEQRHEVRHRIRTETRRAKRFEMLDNNEDGVLTLAELQTKLEKLRGFDSDSDGVVTREELREHRDEIRELRKQARRDQQQG